VNWTADYQALIEAGRTAGLRIIRGLPKIRREQPPEPIEEYISGVASGRHCMARLRHLPDGPWRINVIHAAADAFARQRYNLDHA
jgi:hypothetical protein